MQMSNLKSRENTPPVLVCEILNFLNELVQSFHFRNCTLSFNIWDIKLARQMCSDCKDVQAGLALYWHQRMILSLSVPAGISKIFVTSHENLYYMYISKHPADLKPKLTYFRFKSLLLP